MSERYLVTGACGFIGSAIVRELLRRGLDVRAVDNFTTGSRSNIEGLEIDFVAGDLRDVDLAYSVVDGADYILHQAALAGVRESLDRPRVVLTNNALSTVNLLSAARDCGVKRFVYASSSSVYGKSCVLPLTEASEPRPASPYAVSKLTGELYCRAFFESYNLETVSLRYFNVYGPRQDINSHYSSVVPSFVRLALSGETGRIFGDGSKSRDFIFIQDVVGANLLACHGGHVAGEIFNIGTGKMTSINELWRAITSIVGRDIDPVYMPGHNYEAQCSQADVSNAEQILGYKPKTDLLEGLKRTISWFSNQGARAGRS
jgi:nucleoside-diphosphate-sugar epimerase